MNSQVLEKFMKIRAAAKEEMDKNNAELARLREKFEIFDKNFPLLQQATKAALTAKTKALADCAADLIPEAELQLVRKVYDDATKAEVEATELIEAVSKAMKRTSENVGRLSQSFAEANGRVWRCILDGYLEQIKQAAGNLPVMALAAAACAGVSINFNVFANTPPGAIKEAQDTLKLEYFGEGVKPADAPGKKGIE